MTDHPACQPADKASDIVTGVPGPDPRVRPASHRKAAVSPRESADNTSLPGSGNHLAWMKPSELADMLKVNLKTIYRWADTDPSMPVLRIGSTVRFPRERVLAWITDHEQGVPQRRRRQRFRKPVLSSPQVLNNTGLESGANGSCAHPCAQEAP